MPQGKPISVPGVETQAQSSEEGELATAETAPTDRGLPPMQSPGSHMELAASAPATDMPSAERVSHKSLPKPYHTALRLLLCSSLRADSAQCSALLWPVFKPSRPLRGVLQAPRSAIQVARYKLNEVTTRFSQSKEWAQPAAVQSSKAQTCQDTGSHGEQIAAAVEDEAQVERGVERSA